MNDHERSKMMPASSPDAYVDALNGWCHGCVARLRKAVLTADGLEETIKWGHLVYLSDGPVLLIRAEPHRVLLGFWRGQRLRELEPRLEPGGKYEMATMELLERTRIPATRVQQLARQAVALNERWGNPTHAAAGRAR